MKKEKLSIDELRESLKQTIADELENLPKLLEGADRHYRLNALIKLIPYVMTKAEPEPDNDIWSVGG
jgi:hypothetical protein